MSFGLSLFAVFLSIPLLPGCASLARRYIYKRTPPTNPLPPAQPPPPPPSPPPPPPIITMATAEKQQQKKSPIKDEPLDDDKQDDFSDEYEDDFSDEDDDQGQDTSGKAVQARQRGGQTISSTDKPPAPKQKKGIDDEEGLKLKLDINLDIEVELKARIHGDLTLALLA